MEVLKQITTSKKEALSNRRRLSGCKRRRKDCSDCRHFEGWEVYNGQHDEYGRCEVPPYNYPICKVWDKVEHEHEEQLWYENFKAGLITDTGKARCRLFKNKR